MPNVITDVLTTSAAISDFAVLPTIQQNLAARNLTPCEQIVDSGYMTADHMISSERNHDIDLLGPIPPDQSWQAQADEGFAAAQFVVNWEEHNARCPQGKMSVSWHERTDRHGHAAVHIKFAAVDCQACAVRAQCTQSSKQGRQLQLRDREQYEVLQAARQRQQTEVYREEYAHRAGIEGTISQGARGATCDGHGISERRRHVSFICC